MKHFTKHNNFICNLQLKIGIQINSTVDTEKKNQILEKEVHTN